MYLYCRIIRVSVSSVLRLSWFNHEECGGKRGGESTYRGGEIPSVRMATVKTPFFALQRHISPALVRLTKFFWRWTRQIV